MAEWIFPAGSLRDSANIIRAMILEGGGLHVTASLVRGPGEKARVLDMLAIGKRHVMY